MFEGRGFWGPSVHRARPLCQPPHLRGCGGHPLAEAASPPRPGVSTATPTLEEGPVLQKGAVLWLWGVPSGEVHPLNECMRTGSPLGPVLALASLVDCTHEEPRPLGKSLGSHCDFPGLCGLEGLLYLLLMK